jgi:hypothetical protein
VGGWLSQLRLFLVSVSQSKGAVHADFLFRACFNRELLAIISNIPSLVVERQKSKGAQVEAKERGRLCGGLRENDKSR